MRLILSVLLFFGMSLELLAQSDTSSKQLQDVVIYANKFPTLSKNIVQRVVALTDKVLLQQQANTADILTASGQVFVQKSQAGGGSPVVRGFEASRVLLMVDGVRMNSAIFRAGHLQNIITVDNMILDRVEIIYGPSSTLFGSDALGGVVNLFTKQPQLFKSNLVSKKAQWKTNGNLVYRFGNGQNEQRQHVDLNIANNRWAFLTSVTKSNFGDMRQGNKRLAAYPDFGKRLFYVARENNTDVIKDNSAFVNIQKLSGYNQIDLLQKVLFKPNDNTEHLLNVQVSNSSDINRYDRLTETSNGLPIFSEWYYGPQVRNMIGYKLTKSKLNGYFQKLTTNINYQHLEESRITRRFKSNNKDYRFEAVDIFGLNMDLLHQGKSSTLNIGVESYYNDVSSTAYRNNIATNVRSAIATRYSDGPTNMSNYALYAQHTQFLKGNWVLNSGLRLNNVQLNANFKDTALMHFPFTDANQNNTAITGNLGMAYNGADGLRVTFGVSSGFRSPNVDDLTKVFDTRTGYVVVPNKALKPEYTYNTELNISKTTSIYSIGASLFYTWFRNALVVDKFKWNNASSIPYQGIMSDVYATQNKAKAVVYGFNVNGSANLSPNTTLAATYTYTKGTYQNGLVEMPLDHIPPTYGRVGLKHDVKKFSTELFTVFNGWKRIEDYNLNGEDNEIYATKDGMPAWQIWNINTNYQLTKKLNFSFQIENIADLNYRYFASGISALGRNYLVQARYSF
ncbi:MAG: TonB-dependent receptor plug domain-containing protein [Sediminibacterium sp.]